MAINEMKNTSLNTILILDDDEVTHYINKKVIEKANLDVTVISKKTVIDAIKYLAIADKEDDIHPMPNLVLLDINMPWANGWDFVESFEQISEEQGESVVIIILSSVKPDKLKTKLKKYKQIKGFIPKPLTSRALMEICEEHFSTKI